MILVGRAVTLLLSVAVTSGAVQGYGYIQGTDWQGFRGVENKAIYTMYWGSFRGEGVLMFTCSSRDKSVSVSYSPPDDHSYFSDTAEITYRLDDGTPVTEAWAVWNDGQALQFATGAEFARRLLEADRLRLQTTTDFPGTNTHYTQIPLEDFSTAWAWLVERCRL